MTTFGLQASGFIKKTQKDIETSMEESIQQNGYPSYIMRPSESDTSNDVLLITIASELADVWENLEALYYSFIPSFAQSTALDNIAEITDVTRLIGVKTIVECTFVGTSGTIIPKGSIVSVSGTSYTISSLGNKMPLASCRNTY